MREGGGGKGKKQVANEQAAAENFHNRLTKSPTVVAWSHLPSHASLAFAGGSSVLLSRPRVSLAAGASLPGREWRTPWQDGRRLVGCGGGNRRGPGRAENFLSSSSGMIFAIASAP